MTLVQAIEADPMLRFYDRKYSTSDRKAIRASANGFCAFIAEADLLRDVEPEAQYGVLCMTELNYLERTKPKHVGPVALALALEEILSESDQEPGQAEYRTAITMAWLRARLAIGSAN